MMHMAKKYASLANLQTFKENLDNIFATKEYVDENSVQPDWSVNDPEAKDYIKNRTHWSETEYKDLLSNFECTVQDGYADLPQALPLVENQEYKVTVNGTEYNLITRHYDAWGGGLLGNAEYLEGVSDGIDEDVPFAIDFYSDESSYFNAPDGIYSISIYGEVTTIHKIDEKYLPKSKMTFVSSTHNTTEISDDELKNIQITVPVLDGPYGDEEVVCAPDGTLHLRNDYTTSASIGAIEINSNTFTEGQFIIPYVGGTFQKLLVKDVYTKTKCDVILPYVVMSGTTSSEGVIDKTYTQALAYINGEIFTFETNTVDLDEATPDALTLTVKKKVMGGDTLELITVEDIDTICGTVIQLASEVEF